MTKVAIKSIITAAVLGVAAGVSVAASASQWDETVIQGRTFDEQAIRISYSAAHAATPEGRAVLEARIEQAAREICGPSDLHLAGSLATAARNDACFEDTVDAALSQIGAGSLAQVGE